MVKNLPAMQETQVQSLGQVDALGMATHSSILTWKIPWTEEPGRLQSMGTEQLTHTYICRKKQSSLYSLPLFFKLLAYFYLAN